MRQHLALALLLGAALRAEDPVKYRAGDDPRWAAPDFNDAAWEVSADGKVPPSSSPDAMVWARTRVTAPAENVGPLAVMWPARCNDDLAGPAELFLNGQSVAKVGNLPPRPDFPLLPDCVYPVPGSLITPGQKVDIAVRVWTGVWGVTRNRITPLSLGPRALLEENARRRRSDQKITWMAELAWSVLMVLLGLVVLLCWHIASGQRFLFWFGVSLLLLGWAFLKTDLDYGGWLPASWRAGASISCVSVAAAFVCLLQFQWAAYRFRRSGLLRGSQLAVIVFYGALFADNLMDEPYIRNISPFLFAAMLLTMASVPLAGLRRPGEGRLIAATFLIFAGTFIGINFLGLPLTFMVGPFMIASVTAAMMCVVLTISGVLLRRTWKNWQHRQRIEGEFEAARQVQSALITLQRPRIPGFDVEAAYLPAEEVGGDFYHVIPCNDDSSLIAIGDVSGKGLKAAMVVAMVGGSIETAAAQTSSPADLLARLNAVLTGRLDGGFVTCCCLRLDPGGEYTIANAGHIVPLIDGRLLSLTPGLPLGISANNSWPETTGTLKQGQAIVLVSDGIVEARRSTGELYGFERVEADAADFPGAAALAEKARAFGQEDDITVLAITRREAGAYAA